jgi:hypothetical protein
MNDQNLCILIISTTHRILPDMATPLHCEQSSQMGLKNLERKMKTGIDANEGGTYVSECCDYEVKFSVDQTFTRCPKCSGLTTWELVDLDWPMAA